MIVNIPSRWLGYTRGHSGGGESWASWSRDPWSCWTGYTGSQAKFGLPRRSWSSRNTKSRVSLSLKKWWFDDAKFIPNSVDSQLLMNTKLSQQMFCHHWHEFQCTQFSWNQFNPLVSMWILSRISFIVAELKGTWLKLIQGWGVPFKSSWWPCSPGKAKTYNDRV